MLLEQELSQTYRDTPVEFRAVRRRLVNREMWSVENVDALLGGENAFVNHRKIKIYCLQNETFATRSQLRFSSIVPQSIWHHCQHFFLCNEILLSVEHC